MSDPARCPVTDEHGARCFRDAGHDLLPGAVPGCYFGVNEPTPRRASPDSPPEPEPAPVDPYDLYEAQLFALAKIGRGLLVAMRENTEALRALTSTLGQRTEQEATYPPTVTLNPEPWRPKPQQVFRRST